MGNLSKTTVYLSGPIDHDPDPVSWRDKVTNFLAPYGPKIYDPCKKTSPFAQETQDLIHLRKEYKLAGQYEKVKELMKPIISWDLGAVDESRIIIARIDQRVPMCGTVWELAIAALQQKMILLFSTSGKYTVNDWFFHVIPLEHIFEDMEEMFSYLDRLDKDINTDTTGKFKIL